MLPTQKHPGEIISRSAGADGRRNWSWEAAEPAAPTCPASATTLAMPAAPHLYQDAGIILVFTI